LVARACVAVATVVSGGAQMGATSTVRAIDLRYLERDRWGWTRSLGKKNKFVTVVSNLDTGEPLWFGQERKKETLDEFFRSQLSGVRERAEVARVDIWEPCRLSIEESAPPCCKTVYDKPSIDPHEREVMPDTSAINGDL
jgi:transposase